MNKLRQIAEHHTLKTLPIEATQNIWLGCECINNMLQQKLKKKKKKDFFAVVVARSCLVRKPVYLGFHNSHHNTAVRI